MQIRVKQDSVEVEGYVNAIERKSRPLRSRIGQFIERIRKGAFTKALARNDNIRLLLNHDWSRDLGGTKDGNLELTEDNIGLHAKATITDPEVIVKARNGDLVGWSFGFEDIPDQIETTYEGGMPTRDVKDLNLYEVSLLDRRKTPAYDGTLVSVRSDDNVVYWGEALISDVQVREDPPETKLEQPEAVKDTQIDYSIWEKLINEMREDVK